MIPELDDIDAEQAFAYLANRLESSMSKIQTDVQALKDSRFRHSVTSISLFMALVLGVMTYVYQLEMRFTRAIFLTNDRIHEFRSVTEINSENDDDLRDTLKSIESRLSVIEGRL